MERPVMKKRFKRFDVCEKIRDKGIALDKSNVTYSVHDKLNSVTYTVAGVRDEVHLIDVIESLMLYVEEIEAMRDELETISASLLDKMAKDQYVEISMKDESYYE